MNFSFSGTFFVHFFIEIALCVALILLIRAVFGRLIGPATCRLLWGVLILRCLIPVSIPTEYHPVGFLPELPNTQKSQLQPIESSSEVADFGNENIGFVSLDEFLEIETQNRVSNGDVGKMTQGKDLKTGTPLSVSVKNFFRRVSLPAVLVGIWGGGALMMLFWIFSRNRQVIQLSTRKPIPVPDWIQAIFIRCREELRIGTWPVLIVSPYVGTPCLIGAIRPKILIPQQLVDDHAGDHEAMRYILLHELTHLVFLALDADDGIALVQPDSLVGRSAAAFRL